MIREPTTYFLTRIVGNQASTEQVLLRPNGTTFRSRIVKTENIETGIERGRTYQDASAPHVIVGRRRVSITTKR